MSDQPTTTIALRNQATTALSMGEMFDLGNMLVSTGFLPKGVDTPAKAVAIILKGQELGIPPMYALSNISIINGKPCCSSELMLALIYRDHGHGAVEIIETTDTICRARYRAHGAEPNELAWTIEQAAAAGLLNKSAPPGGVAPWKGYPATMLRWRVISAIAKLAFPDSIAGMYNPEELGARVIIDAEGNVTTEPPPEQDPRQKLIDTLNRGLKKAHELGLHPGDIDPDDIETWSNDELLGAIRALRDEIRRAQASTPTEPDTSHDTPDDEPDTP